MGRVFDDPQAVPPGPGSNRLGVHHEPADVNGNCSDHRRLGRDRRRQTTGPQARDLSRGVGEIHVQRHGIAVHENRNRAQVPDDFAVAANVIVGTRTPVPAVASALRRPGAAPPCTS